MLAKIREMNTHEYETRRRGGLSSAISPEVDLTRGPEFGISHFHHKAGLSRSPGPLTPASHWRSTRSQLSAGVCGVANEGRPHSPARSEGAWTRHPGPIHGSRQQARPRERASAGVPAVTIPSCQSRSGPTTPTPASFTRHPLPSLDPTP